MSLGTPQNININISMVTNPGLSDGLGKISRDHLAVIFKATPVRKQLFFRTFHTTDINAWFR